MTLVKVCPKCGHQNDPSEMFCVGDDKLSGECGNSVALTSITMAPQNPPPGPKAGQGDGDAALRRCQNGHLMVEADTVCIECGAPAEHTDGEDNDLSTRSVIFAERYQVLRPLEVTSGEADLFLCDRVSIEDSSCSLQFVVKHYRRGILPNEHVQRQLQLIKSQHCLSPVDFGEQEGRAFEVYEYLASGTLADISDSVSRQDAFVLAFVNQMASALDEIHQAQLLHRDLKPANILLRSVDPPHFVLADFGASAISESDMYVTTTRRTTRYAAPESFAGITSTASDWWNIGIIALEMLSGRDAMEGIDDRAFMLSIIARPVPIPDELADSWKILLKGLLTRDHTLRWGREQVVAWIAGDEPLTNHFEEQTDQQTDGPAIKLGGQDHHTAARYTLIAAHRDNWNEAVAQMTSGELGTWLAEGKIDDKLSQDLKLIFEDHSLDNDQRLMLGLLVLNEQLRLCYRGDWVTAQSFTSNAQRNIGWLTSSIPRHLSRLGRELWLVDLSERRESVKALITKHQLRVDPVRLDALSLIANTVDLERQWTSRQSDFPEPRHPVLRHFSSRQSRNNAETVALLAAPLDEFRSADEIVAEALVEAKRAELDVFFDANATRELLGRGRANVMQALSELLSDFVRCGFKVADEWADTFRFDHRINLARAAVLFCVPPQRWIRLEGDEHWRQLLNFFHRKVLSSIQRGPLMSLRIGTNAARIDLAQLGSDAYPAERLLESILSRDTKPPRVDPNVLAADTLLQRRLRRLRNNCENYQRDTGISSLYLGFPFLVRRDRDAGQSTPRFVPLLLWPIKLHYPEGQNTSLRISADCEQDGVRLNPALGVSLNQTRKQSFNQFLAEIQGRDSIASPQLMELLQALFNTAHDQVFNEFGALPSEPRLPTSIHSRVIASGVLFQCDFAGQGLADELDRLQKLPFSQSPAIATLLRLQEPSIIDLPKPPSAEHRFLVSSADPSQEAAVYAARTPPGLLIQGPPGTGKSQTIVNIVADAVARNQSVLVVCQKQPALEVVAHRLEAEGLGDRMALIGDPSKDRRPFLQRLRGELEDLNSHGDRNAAAVTHCNKAGEVTQLENEIDGVHEAMTHKIADSGLTYEQVVSELIGLEKDGRKLPLPSIRELLSSLNIGEVTALAKQIENYAPLWLQAKHEGSALHALKPLSLDQETIQVFKQDLTSFVQHEHERMQGLESGKEAVDINQYDMLSIAAWLPRNETSLTETPDSILKMMKVWVELFENGVADGEVYQLEGIAAAAEANIVPNMELRFRNKLAELDDKRVLDLYRDCQRIYRSRHFWLRQLWPPYRGSRRRISESLEVEHTQLCQEVESILAVLKYESSKRSSCREFERSRTRLRLQSPQVNLPPQHLSDKARSLIASLRRARSLIDQGESCPLKTAFLATLRTGQTRKLNSFLDALRQGVVLYDLRDRSLKQLARLQTWMESTWIAQVNKTIRRGHSTSDSTEAILSAWDTLAAFQTFRLRFNTIAETERTILVAMSEVRSTLETVSMDEASTWMGTTVLREAYLAWRGTAEQERPCLLIERDEFESKVKWLRKACLELGSTVRSLVPTLPHPEQIAPRNRWDDVVMLTGPRAKKLRETVGMGKELGLYQLRPIWLANPDTVSRIFPLQEGLFDVVVFDEASQLPVEYALPAIYRGKMVVVSGDEKQLPPTNFFSAAFEDEDCDDEQDDLNGDELAPEAAYRGNRREVKDCTDLLELASPVFPKVMLNVHYRSRYRQLIDFSNAAYYESRLSVPVLHPLEKVSEFKPIQFVEVNGVYDNQTNDVEAEKVVKELHRFWTSNSNEQTPTIGVVTFNLKQAELIEEKLEKLAEEDTGFRTALQQQRIRTKDGQRCGFFVKNVENVQGDERDCMIFSTTFGKNLSGTFRRNFGVLGQRGGERRLNVATTRAKERMVIFSSMPLEQISDVRQSLLAPQTPRDYLQAYLMYAKAISESRFDDAKRILAAMGTQHRSPNGHVEICTPFISEVQKFLEQEGWQVERPLANDAFRFDLAIRRTHDGMFAIAINCDSPRHSDLRFARHRELWRGDVLRSTVPIIHRVWSRMWLIDSASEKKRLLDAVNNAMGK